MWEGVDHGTEIGAGASGPLSIPTRARRLENYFLRRPRSIITVPESNAKALLAEVGLISGVFIHTGAI